MVNFNYNVQPPEAYFDNGYTLVAHAAGSVLFDKKGLHVQMFQPDGIPFETEASMVAELLKQGGVK